MPLGERLTAYAFRAWLDPDGFDAPRNIDDLTEEQIRRGHSDAGIALILGGNFRRLPGAVWTGPRPAQGERGILS